MYGGVEVQLQTFLTLAQDGGDWSASQPSCFTLGERSPSSHWIEDWEGPKASLEVVLKKKSFPAPAVNQTMVIQPTA